MALIELDLTAQPETAPPARRYRLPGLLVALALLVTVGGAAPAVSVLWRYVGEVPSAGGFEAAYRLAGGRLITMSTDGADRVATAWSVGDTPREVWRTRFPARVIGPEQIRFGAVEARQAGDVLLLSDGPSTTAVDAADGTVRWSSPIAVQPLPGLPTGVRQTQQFRAGTVYDQNSGDPGALWLSSTGEPHVEPPTRTEIGGVDLATGQSRWSVTAPGSVSVFGVSAGGPKLLVLSTDRLERRDGDTGTLEHVVAMPRLGGSGPASGELVDGLLLVRWSGAGHEIAYDPMTLRKRWERDVPQVLFDPATCDGLVCAGGRNALDVLDPATGRTAWRAAAGVDLSGRGGYVMEIGSASGAPVRLADRATGRTRVELGGWLLDVRTGEDGPIVLRRFVPPSRTAFAVVDPRRDRLQLLGAVDGMSNDCAADAQYVVCRDDRDLRIWAYRS